VLGPAVVREAGSAANTITVRYYDGNGVDASTLDGSDLRVTGPNGYNQSPSLLQVMPTGDPRHVTAVYSVPAPGGTWDRADQGDYTVSLRAAQVQRHRLQTTSRPGRWG